MQPRRATFERPESSRRRGGRWAFARGGFTFVEILLVLAVLVIFAALTLPLLQGSYERHQLTQTVDEVRQRLASTGIYAKDQGLIYQFRFEPGGRRYLVVPYELDADATPGTGGTQTDLTARYPMRSAELPKGYHFQSAYENGSGQTAAQPTFLPVREEILKCFPNSNELASAGSWEAVLFYPDGTATPGPVVVRNENKQSITLSIRELTGAVSMTQVREEQR